jgi:hypothetical protein
MKQEVGKLIDRLNGQCSCYGYCHPKYKHPILIGDVLEKIIKPKIDGLRMGTELMRLWGWCGFTKSLQQIVEESGYIDCGCKGGEKHDYLKDHNAKALLTYLIDIV